MPISKLPTIDRSVFRLSRKPKLHAVDDETVLELQLAFEAKLDVPVALEDMQLYLGDLCCDSEFEAHYAQTEKRKAHVTNVTIRIKVETIYRMPIHSNLFVCMVSDTGASQQYLIAYSRSFLSHFMRYTAAHTKLFYDEKAQIVAFCRQSKALHTVFTVRHVNVTDKTSEKVKLFCAFVLSKVAFWTNPVLMFEKNGRHYEESGRAVFEQLVDKGYKHVRFILNKTMQDQLDIEAQYRKHMVRQFSFSHYLMFFRCKTFLGSETLEHVLELRCQNLFAQRKLRSSRNTYVFLQHGVMLMVPLDAPKRNFFQRKSMKGNVNVVVSSEREASHFVEHGGFDSSETILCGLPKFDRSYLNKGADKILIMPTWRAWEFNEMRHDASQTGYVRLIERIVGAIPDHLRDKIVIAHHPLFDSSTFLTEYSQEVSSYDELLRDVSLLITDYSSISFDSFYRGSNVIFYWEDYDECMEHYGEGTQLVMGKDEAFGPVYYDSTALSAAVERLYGKQQEESYQQRFQHLVKYHDGRNTDRLIHELETRGILSSPSVGTK